MPCRLIDDVQEWINEISTVPVGRRMKPQLGERAEQKRWGKKTLTSFTTVYFAGRAMWYSYGGASRRRKNPPVPCQPWKTSTHRSSRLTGWWRLVLTMARSTRKGVDC